MKIAEISKLKFSDGKEKWRVNLEDDKKALWLDTTKFPTPPFKVGDDIPEESLQLSQSGKGYVLKAKSQPVATSERQRYTPDGEDWTNIRTAVMQAVELEKHHIIPTGKVDVGAVMQNAAEIFAAMVVMKPTRGNKDA